MTTRDDLADPVVPTTPAIVPPEAPAGRPTLPWSFGIIVVAILRLVDAAGLLWSALELGMLPLRGFPIVGTGEVTRAIELGLAILSVIGVVGLLARQGWGWVLTMVLVGVGLLGEIIRYAIGHPDPLGMLVLVISAFYLNQRSVRSIARRLLEDDD